MDSQQCMWFSRLSFGVSVAALLSMLVGGGCQSADPDLGPEQVQPTRVSAVTEEAPPPNTQLAVVSQPGADTKASKVEEKVDEPKAEANPKPEASKEPQVATEPLQLRRLVVTQEIVDREPAAVDTITLDERPVVAFLDFKNPDEVAQKVVITFSKEGSDAKVGFIELEVPGKARRWRTWGNTRRITEPGTWVAVVSTQDGEELGRQAFEVAAKLDRIGRDGAQDPIPQQDDRSKAPITPESDDDSAPKG